MVTPVNDHNNFSNNDNADLIPVFLIYLLKFLANLSLVVICHV